jgi:hypothetical protein
MTEILKADLFFFISSIGFIILGTLAGIALVYIVKLSRKANHILDDLHDEVRRVKQDIVEFRASARAHKNMMVGIIRSLTRKVMPTTKGKKSHEEEI